MENLPTLTNQKALKYLMFIRENHERQKKEYPKLIAERKPRFDYQNLPNSESLSYELLTWDNFKLMLDLFQHDKNPFVAEDFKNLEQLEDYVVGQLEYSRYSFKQGACDWFLRLKDTDELVGTLHIYDLNWELLNGRHPACVIGYGIAEKFRQQGFATEATQHLLKQIPLIFKRYEVMANPKIANKASRRLLENLGFKEERHLCSDESWWLKKLIKNIPLKTVAQVRDEQEKYR
jgi:RimJ/RimL family protein N-acetyltransferase